MRKILLRYSTIFRVLTVFILSVFFNSCNEEDDIPYLQIIAERIADKWIPDKREGIADLIILSSNESNKTIILKGETDCRELKQEVIDTLKKKGFSIIDSLLVLPSYKLGDYKYGIASLSVINLRRTPGHKEELINQSVMGTPLKILKEVDFWLLVQTPDRYIAWTEKSSVQLMSLTEMKKWRDSPKFICIDNSGWIYESPEEKAVVGDFVAGCIMKSAGYYSGYQKVILPDGREGFIRGTSVLEFEKWKEVELSDGSAVYKTASTMMGLPYLWGGSSTKAVDCSGFAQTVYFLNGIILSRDASLQSLHGSAVDISDGWNNLHTGDLLFFGTVRNSKPHVTHVAIYKGDSEFIHSSGRVMVNSLDSTRANFSSYRKHTLLSARRIIGSVGSPGIVIVRDFDWF